MKNKEFFYLQYDKLKWENQEKTKINSFVNKYIIDNFILRSKASSVKLFDIGFGIGFLFQMLGDVLPKHFKDITLEGCEPSSKNYHYFSLNSSDLKKGIKLKTFEKPFLDVRTDTKFDFITSIYTFTAFVFEELVESAKKIHAMLNKNGKAILVVANDKYLNEKLETKKDLFIEKGIVEFEGKKYKEILHYSEIPQIGTVIGYNREESLYIDLFTKNGFNLFKKETLNDNGFICSIFVFEKV